MRRRRTPKCASQLAGQSWHSIVRIGFIVQHAPSSSDNLQLPPFTSLIGRGGGGERGGEGGGGGGGEGGGGGC